MRRTLYAAISVSVFLLSFSTTLRGQITDSSRLYADTIPALQSIPKPATPVTIDSSNALERTIEPRSPSAGIFPTGDLRSLDGLFIGLGYKQSNRKGGRSYQKLSVMKNLKSEAFQAKYQAEWFSISRQLDITADAFADIKGNILNFFGRGNDSQFDEGTDFQKYYRVKFSLYQLDPALRFKLTKHGALSFGPSIQFFSYSTEENDERFIGQYLSATENATISHTKGHAGIKISYVRDTRNSELLPSAGTNFSISGLGYTGLNSYSSSFAQLFSQLSLYRSLNRKGSFVLAERFGGAFTLGKTAFYQSAFLGSQDNLLGFRKFRFAGDHVVYNNLEARLTVLDITTKARPWKLGLIGFYDAGRVWADNDKSTEIHQGYGGGLFLTPLNRIVLRAVAGFSNERMQLTAAVRQRF